MTRLLAAAIVAALAAPDRSRLETATNLQAGPVTISVAVEQADGTPVTGLARGDFEVFVDSAPRAIDVFSGESLPLAVVMLVDISSSMRRMAEDRSYRSMLEAFIRDLEMGDRASVGQVSASFAMSREFSGERAALFGDVTDTLSVRDLDRFGPSPLWDSIAVATGRLSEEPGSRVVILWTDGRSTGNRLGMVDVADLAIAAGVSIHFILEELPIYVSRVPGQPTPCGSVLPLTTATGGACWVNRWTVPRYGPPSGLLRRVVRSLHNRYTLGFTADARDGQVHTLDVRVKQPGLRARAPTRYLAAK